MVGNLGFEPRIDGLRVRCLNHLASFPWSGRRDSNPRHPRWQRGALPTELLPRKVVAGVGLEPTSFKATDFESAVYTNSTIQPFFIVVGSPGFEPGTRV